MGRARSGGQAGVFHIAAYSARRIVCLSVIFSSLLIPSGADASANPTVVGAAEAGALHCQLNLEGGMCSKAETWVWGNVFSGLESDLGEYTRQQPGLSNILRPGFILALIIRGNDSAVVSAHGITIRRASVCEPKTSLDDPDCSEFPPRSVIMRNPDP